MGEGTDGEKRDGAEHDEGHTRRVLLINCWDRAPEDNAPDSTAIAATPVSTSASAVSSAVGAATAVPCTADAAGATGAVRVRCEPRSSWLPFAVERCCAEAAGAVTGAVVGMNGGRPPNVSTRSSDGDTAGTQLSTVLFGDVRPLVTTVDAPAAVVVRMLGQPYAPSWLPIRETETETETKTEIECADAGSKRPRDVDCRIDAPA